MGVIHKKCNAEIKATIITKMNKKLKTYGDWGYCTLCEKRVDHLILKNGQIGFSEEVRVT